MTTLLQLKKIQRMHRSEFLTGFGKINSRLDNLEKGTVLEVFSRLIGKQVVVRVKESYPVEAKRFSFERQVVEHTGVVFDEERDAECGWTLLLKEVGTNKIIVAYASDCRFVEEEEAVDVDGEEEDTIITDVGNCARCGGDHLSVVFRPYKQAMYNTHWATCPTTGEPINLHIILKPA